MAQTRYSMQSFSLYQVQQDLDEEDLVTSYLCKTKSHSVPASPAEIREGVISAMGKITQLESDAKSDMSKSSESSDARLALLDAALKPHLVDLHFYHYQLARIRRWEALRDISQQMRKNAERIKFLPDFCRPMVQLAEKTVLVLKGRLTLRPSLKSVKRGKEREERAFLKKYTTPDHLLMLFAAFKKIFRLFHMCCAPGSSWWTFLYENPSHGVSSPFVNLMRRVVYLCERVEISAEDLGTNMSVLRKGNADYYKALMKAVDLLLKDPGAVLPDQLARHVTEDMGVAERRRGVLEVQASKGDEQVQVMQRYFIDCFIQRLGKLQSADGMVVGVIEDAVKKAREEYEEYLEALEKQNNTNLDMSYKSMTSGSFSRALENPGEARVITWSDLDVLGEIGVGAFAMVHEAKLSGERVAVKKVKDDVKDALSQLQNEVEIMSKLRSDYIIEMYGASFRPGQTIMVMEFMPRGSLFDILSNTEERLSWKMKWKLAVDAALGLHYIHSCKPPIVHRDLKTGNYLVSQGWRVKLCDFGLAIPVVPPPPAINCGTVRWTAPEINDSQVYTTKSDVYSYAIILWEIASREIPWKEETNDSTIKRVARGDRPDIPSDTPLPFEMIMRDCWEQEPEKRLDFGTIVQLFNEWGIAEWIEQLQGEDDFDNIRKEYTAMEKKANSQAEYRKELEDRQRQADRDRQAYTREKRELELEKNEAMRKERDEVQKITALERQIHIHKSKLHDVNKSIRASEKKAEKYRDEAMEEWDAAKKEAQQEIDDVDKKIKEERAKNEDIKKELKNLENEKAALEEVLKEKYVGNSPRKLQGYATTRGPLR
mmetsp:Transcript_31484/g.88338  ORF Transcript_31484/g.88338 Transcript_31484/m.88338 type:complete len:826 (+) Transcript_31484:132-2609(+)